MTDEDTVHLLLPILELRAYARMRDREGAANPAAIADLPLGWLFEDPRRERDKLILRATSAEGDGIEVSGATAEKHDAPWPSRWLR